MNRLIQPRQASSVRILKCRTRVALRIFSRNGEALCRWPMWRILSGASTLHECAGIDFGGMGNIGNVPRTGLGCNALTEWWLPGAGAFGFAPENGWAWGASGVCGKIPAFRCCRLVSERAREQRRSMQVIVQRRILVEGPPDLTHMNPARFMRDMRKSSVFKHGRFPDTHC
jgi:hypothetical protein